MHDNGVESDAIERFHDSKSATFNSAVQWDFISNAVISKMISAMRCSLRPKDLDHK